METDGEGGKLPPMRIRGGAGREYRAGFDEAVDVRFGPEQLELLAGLVAEKMAGAPPPPPPVRPLFAELAAQWLESIRTKRVAPDNELRLLRRLRPLGLEDEDTLTVAKVDAHLATLTDVAPGTVNKIRGAGRLVIEYAQASRQWGAVNPFALVKRVREPRRKYERLSLEELRAVAAKLRPDRRREFRVALHLGLRTGELFALRKSDVDFTAATITIQRSHHRDETKTGSPRVIPLLPAIAGDLLEAMQASPSELVFPMPDGSQQREDAKMSRTIHTAMKLARVGVVAVTYKCRRPSCRWQLRLEGPAVAEEQDCPSCGFRLWPAVEVKPYRWYDLRHSCATFHHQAGASTAARAILLGHTLKSMTDGTYTHPTPQQLMAELSRWSL